MKLPNGENAIVDVEKLSGYCLSLGHPRGRHKARVFARVLGLRADDSEELRDALLRAARTSEATHMRTDDYGERYVLDFTIEGPKGAARLRSIWMVRRGEDVPRFVTCYVM